MALAALLCLAPANALADSVAPKAADNSVAAELASFEIADGYAVSLFASEAEGIANPIAIRFDSRGRLWVLCSLVYPQILPTQRANDQLHILEDTDHDGRADRTSVFAGGLDMPTGFALGEGGVFVGEGPNLLFLRDTDGDDRADEREEWLSGFGTEDTHQNINSFAWSPGGELFFCQGLHGYARVETPWGIVRLDEHGVWRLRPRRLQLHAFRGGSSQNPWGVAHGPWGQPFVKGGSDRTFSELLPIMVPTDHFHPPLDIGATPIKSMIAEIIDSPTLPADLQGDVLIAGYFAHVIDRMSLMPDGAGHKTENRPPLLRSSHRSFRPVDIQTGPDGALYVADWFNPIIGHYQASLRHPDRDKEHGRVWRITATDKPTLRPADLTSPAIPELLRRLPAAPLRERERIRVELSMRNPVEVLAALGAWTQTLLETAPRDERALFEALCLYEWNETVHEPLLEALLSSTQPLARAYATRVVGRWHDRLPNPLARLQTAILDAHPRVRLEAVVASSYIPSPEAITVAARALDHPIDRFIEAALVQAAHALHPYWSPALLRGDIAFASPAQLAFVLTQSSGGQAASAARALLDQPSLSQDVAADLLAIMALHGTRADLDMAFDRGRHDADVLDALADAATLHGTQPATIPVAELERILAEGSPDLRPAALRLAKAWKLTTLATRIETIATDTAQPAPARTAAIDALTTLHPAGAPAVLQRLASNDAAPAVRHAAVEALCRLDLAAAANLASALLRKAEDPSDMAGLVRPFASHAQGPQALARALAMAGLEPDRLAHVRNILGTAGRHSAELDQLLPRPGAGQAVGQPEYRDDFVKALAGEVSTRGSAARGADIYARPALSCAGCHKVGNEGGVFGPELTAVGAGLPVELIIEAVLWPERQVKEGFLATTLHLRGGEIVSGYVQRSDPGRILIRDIATAQVRVIAQAEVQSRQDAGTVMPPGLTAALTREELRDLIRYLSDLRL